jgi:Ferritin-like domain
VVSPDSDAARPGGGRREFLRGAGVTLAAGGGVLGLSACGGGAAVAKRAVHKAPVPVRRSDVQLLAVALELERRTVAAYTAGIPLLDRPRKKTAAQFLSEELTHTGELISLIMAAGGHARSRADSYDIGHPRDGGAVIALLHELERAQIVNYVATIPRLSPGPVRAAVATILASDAQHVAILRLTLGLDPVPSAFVIGNE